ncbi:hypothetical protein EI94DRAFT_1782689 [Lactarius quietus]|nr:hypothetical protein EI94DRAFT_1782689 [Lactarius quietus]
MGGGDLNMKKSWHPLLMKNQERVWLEEKKALEEKKKLDQLRKEKEEERQLQELQRLQEEQTGKKRTEKLEWMYATPATGSSQNTNDLEDYLLGKKRVDKILIGTENEKFRMRIACGISQPKSVRIHYWPSSSRKLPPMNPHVQPPALREMQERNGIKPSKKEKKEKKREKRERKEQRRREREERHRPRSPLSDYNERDHDHHHSPRSRRSLSPLNRYSRSPVDSRRFRDRDDRPRPPYSPRRDERRSRSPDPRHERRERSNGFDTGRSRALGDRRPRWPRSDESDPETHRERRGRERSRSAERGIRHGDDSWLKRPRSRSPAVETARNHKRTRPGSPRMPSVAAEDRAARLAAMTTNAAEMSVERKDRLAALLEKEKAELEVEERARVKSKGMGGFLSNEQKKVFGGAAALRNGLGEAGQGWSLRWTDMPLTLSLVAPSVFFFTFTKSERRIRMKKAA